MLPKLSDRAAARCTAHIRRHYPDWKQSLIMFHGAPDEVSEMEDFIARCKSHLVDLREEIAEGDTPCIDTGWPPLNAIEQPPEDTSRLEDLERQLTEAQEALQAKEPEPETPEETYDEPPAELADLIDPSLTPRQNLDVLTAKFAAAKNLEEYARDNGDKASAMKHLKDAERFESGIKWNRAVLVEVV